MNLLLYGALLLAQTGTATKQYAMKRCGMLAPNAFNSICINLARALICLFVSLSIWLISCGNGTTMVGLVISILSGVGTAMNLFAWILIAQHLAMTLIEEICMLGTLVLPLFLAPYLYDGDAVSPLQWIGAILILVSILFFAKKGKEKKKTMSLRNILSLIVCALGATVAAISKKLYSFYIVEEGLGSIEFFTLVSFCSVFVIFALLFPICYRMEAARLNAGTANGERTRVTLPYRRVWHFILMAAAGLYVYEFFTAKASALPSAIYYPASKAIAVLGSFLLDTLVFKDKITLKKTIGLVLLLVAIVLINL